MEIYPSSSLLAGANNVTSAVLDNLSLSIACYVVYFVGGYYIGHHDLSRRQQALIYILAVLAALTTFVRTIAVSWTLGRSYEAFFGNSDLCVALETLGVITWFKYHEPKLNAKAIKRVGQLSSNTFGVYLVHVLVLDTIVYFFRPQILALPAAIYIPLLSAVVFTVGLAITSLVRRVPYLRRIVS